MVVSPARRRLRMKFVTAVVELLMMAPRPPIPAPETTNCLLRFALLPKTSRVAPLLMVTFEPVPPRAVLLTTRKVPAESEMAPPKLPAAALSDTVPVVVRLRRPPPTRESGKFTSFVPSTWKTPFGSITIEEAPRLGMPPMLTVPE